MNINTYLMASSQLNPTNTATDTDLLSVRDQIFLKSWHQGLISRQLRRFNLLKLFFRLEKRLPSWLSLGNVFFALTSWRFSKKQKLPKSQTADVNKYSPPISARPAPESTPAVNGKFKLIAIALLVILPVLAWFVSRSSYRATVQAQSVQVAAISQLTDQAIIYLETGERQQAEKLLAQAKEKFANLPKSAQSTHLYVMAKLLATDEQLSGRYEINQPNFILSFSEILPEETNPDLVGLELSNDILYTVNSQNNNIYRIDLAKSKVVLIGKNFTDGTIENLLLDSKGNVYFYYDSPGLFRYEPVTQEYYGVAVGLGSNENPPTDLGFFGDQLYALSARGRDIYRHGPTGSGFDQGDSWLSESTVDMSQATSFAIDGDIFVALASGEIIKFNRGERVDFASPSKLKKENSNLIIKTRGRDDLLFVLEVNDNDFFVLDKTGALLNEYKLNNIGQIKDFVILDNNSSMLVLAGDELYQVPLRLPLPQ